MYLAYTLSLSKYIDLTVCKTQMVWEWWYICQCTIRAEGGGYGAMPPSLLEIHLSY